MRRIILATVIAIVAHSAQAADMPDLPILRGAMTEGFSTTMPVWQGFYVGGQWGTGRSGTDFSSATSDIANKMTALTALNPSLAPSLAPVLDRSGVSANGYGAFVGYNSQWDDVIVGLEANYMHINFSSSDTNLVVRQFTDSNNFTNTLAYDGTARFNITDMGTIRARAGYAFSWFLPYVFGGVALGQANIEKSAHIYGTQANNVTPFQTVPFDASLRTYSNGRFIYGYAAGLGVDVQLMAGLFLRAEWEYVQFTSEFNTNINTVRAGLGYKF